MTEVQGAFFIAAGVGSSLAGPFLLGMVRNWWADALALILASIPCVAVHIFMVNWYRGMDAKNASFIEAVIKIWQDDTRAGLVIAFALLIPTVWLFFTGRKIAERRHSPSPDSPAATATLFYRGNVGVSYGVAVLGGVTVFLSVCAVIYLQIWPNLWNAAKSGRVERVVALLERGGDPNVALRNGTWKGHIDVVEVGIAHGADVNSTLGSEGTLPLCIAVVWGRVDIAKLLLAEGADPNARDSFGWMPMHALFSGISVKNPAIAKEILRALVNNGAQINAVDGTMGHSALIMAARLGTEELARILIENGADPLITSKRGQTALHVAAQHGNAHIVKLLLDSGVDVNTPDSRNRTALSIVADYASPEPTEAAREAVAKELLSRGAEIGTVFRIRISAETNGYASLARLLREYEVKTR